MVEGCEDADADSTEVDEADVSKPLLACFEFKFSQDSSFQRVDTEGGKMMAASSFAGLGCSRAKAVMTYLDKERVKAGDRDDGS